MQQTTQEELISKKLKERFCKDHNIPIRIFEEPYFSERLQLFAKLKPSIIADYKGFNEELTKYANPQDYFEEYKKIQDEAISFIKSTPEFQSFNEADMNFFAKQIPQNLPAKNIYHASNLGKTFISIDMKQANFNALKQYCKTELHNNRIFGGAETWENFIEKFTDSKHIAKSKYIRQIILGNCNPKRQQTYEKYLISRLYETIQEQFSEAFYKDRLVFFSNDEIVFDVTGAESKELISHRLENLVGSREIPFKVQLFELQKIQRTEGFIKKSEDFIEPKCIDATLYPVILRKIFGETIQENDKVFLFNGLKAKLIDLPKF